jgi:hypothetical protein
MFNLCRRRVNQKIPTSIKSLGYSDHADGGLTMALCIAQSEAL